MRFKNSFHWKALNQLKWPQNLKAWSTLLLQIAIFCVPFQISMVFFESPAWGYGIFNPYAVIEFYLFEGLIALSSLLFLVSRFKEKRLIKPGHLSYYALILAWWFLVLFSLAYQGADAGFALALSAHSGIYLLLYFLIVNRVATARSLVVAFIASMCFQSFVATYQFLTQSSLGLGLLGEVTMDPNASHLARMTVVGQDMIRAYGTLSHPNVLGGFLALSMMGTFFISVKKNLNKTLLLVVQFSGLLFSFSRSALLSLSVALLVMAVLYRSEIQRHSKTLINVVLTVLSVELLVVLWSRLDEWGQSSATRFNGITEAFALFNNYPLGVGFQSYTLYVDEVSLTALMPWEYQPVHNIFMLMLTELGIFGLMLGVWFFIFSILKLYERRKRLLTKQRLQKKRLLLCALLIIAFIGLFDHYWLSLHQGLAVLTLFFGMASAFSSEPSSIKAIKKGAPLQQNPIDLTKSL